MANGFALRGFTQGFTNGLQNVNQLVNSATEREALRRRMDREDQSLELERSQQRVQQATERTSNTARELGLTFSSAFEDAIIKGERFVIVLSGLATDIARVILRRLVTDPLANAASGILGNIDFGRLFNFGSNATTTAPIIPVTSTPIPFARGGVVTSPTTFPIAGGRTCLMGEAGPEAIMPLARDSAGRLGVRGGAPSVTVVNNIDARGADPASEARIFAAIRASAEQTRASVFDAIRRGGSARAIVRGA